MLSKQEKQVLWEMAERAVSIKEGGKVGRWTREDRVALVYSVIYSIIQNKERNKRAKLSTG